MVKFVTSMVKLVMRIVEFALRIEKDGMWMVKFEICMKCFFPCVIKKDCYFEFKKVGFMSIIPC